MIPNVVGNRISRRTKPLPAPLHVDFLQGLATPAPGVSRAQEPLVSAMSAYSRYEIQLLRFPAMSARLWFPLLYGPMPVWLSVRRPVLVQIGNAWYAHLVPLLRGPTIVTCHDLIELTELESGSRQFSPHRRFHIHAAFRGMLQASRIACVSQATADRVSERAPWVAHRIRVIHSGISPVFTPGASQGELLHRLGIHRPYVLYVGSEQHRKNLPRVVAAVAAARRHTPDLQFVKVGASQSPDGRLELLNALDRENMRHDTRLIDYVHDEDLAGLYRFAAATLLISLDEGFGFPALEAMACGCPVVVSNRGALPEVTGGHAIVVDPLDIRALAGAIERVITDSHIRFDLIATGQMWTKSFTWERAAQRYAALYDEVVGL
jgi:glycosyltransferase involved in cell wall biosynthesis